MPFMCGVTVLLSRTEATKYSSSVLTFLLKFWSLLINKFTLGLLLPTFLYFKFVECSLSCLLLLLSIGRIKLSAMTPSGHAMLCRSRGCGVAGLWRYRSAPRFPCWSLPADVVSLPRRRIWVRPWSCILLVPCHCRTVPRCHVHTSPWRHIRPLPWCCCRSFTVGCSRHSPRHPSRSCPLRLKSVRQFRTLVSQMCKWTAVVTLPAPSHRVLMVVGRHHAAYKITRNIIRVIINC